MPNAIYYKQVEQTLDQSEQKKVVTLFRALFADACIVFLATHLYALFTVVLNIISPLQDLEAFELLPASRGCPS